MAWLKSFCALLVYLMMVGFVAGNVVLMGENISKSFDDIEAKFTPKIKGSGENGILYLAEPIDACSPLENKVVGGSKPPFALIIRGRCSFDDKIRSAQSAGFKAAIIYDCVDGAPLIEMGGTPDLIKIHAVFISKSSGKVLKKYAGHTDVELWILPAFENSPWSIMAVSFISLLAMSAMLGTCFFVCKHHVRRERPRAPQVPEFQGMSCHLVKAMPSLIFTTVLEDNCTSRTCAICLEDYNKGEKLRILPCCHKFHAICVDSWLTAWRTFCPVCKRDARMTTSIPPASESTPLLSASESTPLLSSGAPSPSSTAALLSCHSSVAASPSIPVNSLAISPPLQIVSTSPWSAAASRTHSLSSTHHMANSHRSYNNSPGSSINRGFPDLRSIPSQRSQMPHLVSPHSIGLPLRSPYSSRFARPYTASSTDASLSYLAGSSGHCSYLRHSESMGLPLPSPYSSRYARPYNPSSTNASPSYLAGSSDHCSYLRPSESMGLPLPSPCSSRYALPNNASSSNASPSYLVGSSGRCSYLRHCESGASISALASAQSLPSC